MADTCDYKYSSFRNFFLSVFIGLPSPYGISSTAYSLSYKCFSCFFLSNLEFEFDDVSEIIAIKNVCI